MRLFKSQKTRCDRAKLFIKFEFSTPKFTENTYPHSCLRPKIYFCKPVLLLCITNNSIKHPAFVYTLLNVKADLFKTNQFSISTQFKYQTVLLDT